MRTPTAHPSLHPALASYPADGFSKNTLLGAMGNTCERLNAQYTLAGMGGMGGAPTPAPAPAPTTTSSAVPAASSPALLLAALAAFALLF